LNGIKSIVIVTIMPALQMISNTRIETPPNWPFSSPESTAHQNVLRQQSCFSAPAGYRHLFAGLVARSICQ
jgi:hypothetical protein